MIFLDNFEPMMEKKGNIHFLVGIDHATLYVDASPVLNTAFTHCIDYVIKR